MQMLPFLFLPSLGGASFHSRSVVGWLQQRQGLSLQARGCPAALLADLVHSMCEWEGHVLLKLEGLGWVAIFSRFILLVCFPKQKYNNKKKIPWSTSNKISYRKLYFVKEKIKPEQTEAWFHLLKYLKNSLLLLLLHFLQWIQLNKQ